MKKSDVSLIRKAMEMEMSRHKYYSKAEKKTGNIEAKSILNFLARSEKKHYNLLDKNLKRFVSEKALLNLEKLSLKSEMKRKRGLGVSVSDLDAVDDAFDVEKRDPKIYSEIIKKTKSGELKSLFKKLKKQEEQHLNYLKKELKRLRILSAKGSEAKSPRIAFYRFFK